MAIRSDNSTKTAIFGVLIIAGVVVYLYVFHFLLGITWMIYVLVIAVAVLILMRKLVMLKKQNARLTNKTP